MSHLHTITITSHHHYLPSPFTITITKKAKKSLTSFSRNAIELKNSNFIVLFLHKFKQDELVKSPNLSP